MSFPASSPAATSRSCFPVPTSTSDIWKTKTGLRLFLEDNGIYPLQFFDIEFLESWEAHFDLSPEAGVPFAYLGERSRKAELRYRPVDGGLPQRPGPSVRDRWMPWCVAQGSSSSR